MLAKTMLLTLLLTGALAPLSAVAACTAPVYHQFDFWVGNWRVTDAHGKLLGHDLVRKRLGGCVIEETYRDANDPSVGIGFTGYDSGRHMWHQDFMDDGGFVLVLDGSLQGGRMVLLATDYPRGKARLNRGVWSKRGNAVEELWSTSTDGGRTWRVKFDGWFRREP